MKLLLCFNGFFLSASGQNMKRESGRKVQSGNITAAKVPLLVSGDFDALSFSYGCVCAQGYAYLCVYLYI